MTNLADEALQRLLAGNQRYASGQAVHPNTTASRRAELTGDQKPFAIILGCVDSRVPPELIFDCGLGDLLVIRVAGQAIDRIVLGSLEFGVAQLHIPLLMVLGHAQCGAVEATIETMQSYTHAQANIQALVEAVRPAVAQVYGKPGDLLDNAVRANIGLSVRRIKDSPVMAEAMRKDALKIVGAYYALETGTVEVL